MQLKMRKKHHEGSETNEEQKEGEKEEDGAVSKKERDNGTVHRNEGDLKGDKRN